MWFLSLEGMSLFSGFLQVVVVSINPPRALPLDSSLQDHLPDPQCHGGPRGHPCPSPSPLWLRLSRLE